MLYVHNDLRTYHFLKHLKIVTKKIIDDLCFFPKAIKPLVV